MGTSIHNTGTSWIDQWIPEINIIDWNRNSIAHRAEINIQDSQAEAGFQALVARIQVLVMPLFAILGTIQAVLVCASSILLAALGQDHLSITSELTKTCQCATLILLTTIFGVPAGMISPSIYFKPVTHRTIETQTFEVSTWGIPKGNIPDSIDLDALKIDNPDEYLQPTGTRITECRVTNGAGLQKAIEDLNAHPMIDRLELYGEEAHKLFDVDPLPTAFTQIDTLCLKGMTIEATKLETLLPKCPNLACIDLSQCKIEGDLQGTLFERYIVMQSSTNNLQEQHNTLAELFHSKMQNKDGFLRLFDSFEHPTLQVDTRIYPAARFVRKVNLARLDLTDAEFARIIPGLKHFFPKMQTLNLISNKQLTATSLFAAQALELSKLNVRGCNAIYKSVQGTDPHLFKAALKQIGSIRPIEVLMSAYASESRAGKTQAAFMEEPSQTTITLPPPKADK